jgi:hypothetical protein
MTKTKLFKISYKPEHFSNLEQGFDTWDNTANEHPQLCEFPIFNKAYQSLVDTDIDYWGLLSPKFFKKTNVSPEHFLTWIKNQNGNANVYFINPVPIVESLFSSTIQHGDNCHPGMMSLLQRNLVGLLPSSLDNMFMDCNTFALCNYFVGDKIFWQKYLEFVNAFLFSVNFNTADKELLYGKSANYGPNKSLPYYTFVVERLFSIFLNLYKNEIKFAHYTYSRTDLIIKTGLAEPVIDELRALTDIKQMSVSAGYPGMIQHWAFFRNRMAQQHPYLFLIE